MTCDPWTKTVEILVNSDFILTALTWTEYTFLNVAPNLNKCSHVTLIMVCRTKGRAADKDCIITILVGICFCYPNKVPTLFSQAWTSAIKASRKNIKVVELLLRQQSLKPESEKKNAVEMYGYALNQVTMK